MCRIKNETCKYEFLAEKQAKISEGGSVSLIVQDTIKGNITVVISIKKEDGKEGVTRIERMENNKVGVTIVNPNPLTIVAPNEPMEIGNYMQSRKLYMDYKLYKKYDNEEYREIKVEFGTNKKRARR